MQCNVCFTCLRPDSDALSFSLSFCTSVLDGCDGPGGLAAASSACFITSSTFHNRSTAEGICPMDGKELHSSLICWAVIDGSLLTGCEDLGFTKGIQLSD